MNVTEKDIRVINIEPKRGYEHCWPWIIEPLGFEYRCISEDQADDYRMMYRIYTDALTERHIKTSFIVVRNGVFLPVPRSHYAPAL